LESPRVGCDGREDGYDDSLMIKVVALEALRLSTGSLKRLVKN
jgi:hypothetical protein